MSGEYIQHQHQKIYPAIFWSLFVYFRWQSLKHWTAWSFGKWSSTCLWSNLHQIRFKVCRLPHQANQKKTLIETKPHLGGRPMNEEYPLFFHFCLLSLFSLPWGTAQSFISMGPKYMGLFPIFLITHSFGVFKWKIKTRAKKKIKFIHIVLVMLIKDRNEWIFLSRLKFGSFEFISSYQYFPRNRCFTLATRCLFERSQSVTRWVKAELRRFLGCGPVSTPPRRLR